MTSVASATSQNGCCGACIADMPRMADHAQAGRAPAMTGRFSSCPCCARPAEGTHLVHPPRVDAVVEHQGSCRPPRRGGEPEPPDPDRSARSGRPARPTGPGENADREVTAPLLLSTVAGCRLAANPAVEPRQYLGGTQHRSRQMLGCGNAQRLHRNAGRAPAVVGVVDRLDRNQRVVG